MTATLPDSKAGTDFDAAVTALEHEWATNPRWAGVERTYTAADVIRLRGRVREEHTLARLGAERLWDMLHTREYVRALGAITGNQAVQMVKAGLDAIYLSGWQVAADGNLGGETYPDQSLYPANSVPAMVRRINNALVRQDEIDWAENTGSDRNWFAPIMADAEAGFGGALNVFELMKGMITAGAAGVHFEDQLSSEKKCGHMGGKVLIPTRQHVRTLNAARLAADIEGVSSIIVARTDSLGATLLTSDVDDRDKPFVVGDRTDEGFYNVNNGIDAVIARGLAYAPYCDMIWVETGTPDMAEAKQFADALHAEFPGKMMMYNCSPSFNWKGALNDEEVAGFQAQLAAMGYKFQFITLAGFHSLNYSMFELARGYAKDAMTSYVKLQEAEFAAESVGYTAVKHQAEVGAGYFDAVATALDPNAATLALKGSTEEQQFH